MLALLNIAFCAIALGIAYAEKRMTHHQLGSVTFPYVWHGGVWADWTIITIVCYIAGQYTNQWTRNDIRVCVAISAVLSVMMHIAYNYTAPIPGHIIETRHSGLAALTIGGWYHALYFIWALSIILLFYLYTPEAPRLIMSLVLTAFVPLAIWQPGLYVTKIFYENSGGRLISIISRIDAAGWIQGIVGLAVLWLVGYYRLFGWLKP